MSKNIFTIEGIITNRDRQKKGRIEIDRESGFIVKVSGPTGVADIILKDELIFPGFIDVHVHAREDVSHTQDYKEDFVSAGQAAINGGGVAFAEMPNNPVPPVDDASYQEKNSLTKKTPITVLLYALAAPGTKPLSKKVPYKAVLGNSFGRLFFTSLESIKIGLENYRGQEVSFHCEDPKILAEFAHQETHEQKRPPAAEISAVDIILPLIEKYNLVGKICHCSTILGIQKIAEARKRGVNVTVEVTPHHLYFDETMLTNETKGMFQVNPPIRQGKENRLALIAALKSGLIDYLASDHAPHTIEEKKKGMPGLTHLDTYGSFTTWLMKEHNFSPEEITRVCSYNSGNFISKFIDKKFGQIKEGFVGSLTIIDTTKPIVINSSHLKTKSGWSPFLGITFPGSVVMTIIKGKIYANK